MLTFGGTTPLAGLLRLFDFLLGRFLTPYNGGGIPAGVPDKLCREILFYERIVYPVTRSTCIISRIDTKRSSWAVSGVFKHWFKWGSRFSWTRPIKHDTFSVSFMAPSSLLKSTVILDRSPLNFVMQYSAISPLKISLWSAQ